MNLAEVVAETGRSWRVQAVQLRLLVRSPKSHAPRRLKHPAYPD